MAPTKKPAAARRAGAAIKVMKAMKAAKAAMKVMKAKKAMKPVKALKAMKAMKAVKKPSAAMKAIKAVNAYTGKPRGRPRKAIPEELQGLEAYVVNLERRPDRWKRVSNMLKKETPWMVVHHHKASDGTINPIPEAEVAVQWNTNRNSRFADYYEWVFVAPGSPMDGTPWKWAADVDPEDAEWRFAELAEEEFTYIQDAPGFSAAPERTGSVEKIATGETFKVKLQFAQRYVEPGLLQNMSGGERGCAHSHLRAWRIAAERKERTLVLEDDVHFLFDRTGELGKANGKVFTERLALALRHLPSDFDVIYLGWSGWRGGHHFFMKDDPEEDPERKRFIRKSEYVWTTVAYVITEAGAKKLLEAAGGRVDQPVDNFMAWEASQGRLNSYVVVDEGDDDSTWAGGIVDQFDFQGDSDIKKSDGGVQGDDVKEFTVAQ